MRSSLLIIPLCALSAGCGLRGEPEAFVTPTYGADVGDALELAGDFAAQLTFAQCVAQPVGSRFVLQTVTSFQLAAISPGPGERQVTVNTVLCDARLTELAGSTMTPSAGFVARTQDGPYVVELSEMAVGASLSMARQVELRGVTLEDPWTDAMPVDPEDPRIFDYDGDGNGGYEVRVEGPVNAELWTVERMFLGLEGKVYSGDRVAGQLDGWLEDVFIYSSKPGLVPTDTEIRPIVHPTYSFFELVRLDSAHQGPWTCEALLPLIDAGLFAPAEARTEGDPCEDPEVWAPSR